MKKWGIHLINDLLIQFGNIIQNNLWIAPLLSLLAGVITSFTPCSLASVPLIIGYVGNKSETTTKKAFKLSCVFALGTAITYTILGVVASLAGQMLAFVGNWWYLVIGILLIIMALQFIGLIDILPKNNLLNKNKKKGYLGAVIAGMLAGLFSSPCSTPVLIVLLAIVGQQGSLILGISLLLLYSIGHSILIVISGTSVNFVQRLSSSEKYGRFNNIIKIVFGILMFILAFYLIYIGI